MMMTAAWWLLLLLLLLPQQNEAARVQITDKLYPFMATDTGDALRWSSGDMLRMLYFGEWVEMAPRGIRVGTEPLRPLIAASANNNNNKAGRCVSAADMLCQVRR